MSLADDVGSYVDSQLANTGELLVAAGTVVTSPSHISTDPLTVVMDGTALAVPVKQIRNFPIFPGMRVGLLKVGDDWTVLGAFTNPGEGTGTTRMAVGADTPPELQFFGVLVAMLFYSVDVTTGLETGYFFIGLSNTLDVGNQQVCLFGHVTYPTPGDPTSPSASNVKTHFQMNLGGFTIFKDHPILVNASVQTVQLEPGADLKLKSGGSALSGSQGRGIVNYAIFNSASANTVAGAPFSAQIVVTTITDHVFKAGRAYGVEILGGFNSGTAGTSGNFFLIKGTAVGGTQWWDYFWSVPMLAAGAIGGIPASIGYLRRAAGSDLTQSFVLTMRTNNSATGQHYGDANHPRGMVVYDVGSYDDYPHAFAVS